MSANTSISWCDHTFNPWWGCTNVSPGCDHCYAETFSHRLGQTIWGKDAPRRFFGDKHWAEPLAWNKKAEREGIRRRVFCGSMCDVMEDREDLGEHRQRLYSLIEATSSLDWLLLTKRPQNFRRFLPSPWLHNPRPNVWGLTTVETQEYDWRITALLTTPFAIRGLSIEPMLGPIDLGHHAGPALHWVICGGESGNGARPMQPEWPRHLLRQCRHSRIFFFMKQMGGVRDKRDSLTDLPEDLRIRQSPQSLVQELIA